MKPSFNVAARKRPVNLTLNTDLVSHAKSMTDNLSAVVALMAQFDVHRNSGKHKDTIPFVVVVQPAQFDSYRRRVVVPLVRATAIGKVNYAGDDSESIVAALDELLTRAWK